MTYEYIKIIYKHKRVTYEGHISDIRVRTIDIRITYELHTNNMEIT